jgi:hypothetical protein
MLAVESCEAAVDMGVLRPAPTCDLRRHASQVAQLLTFGPILRPLDFARCKAWQPQSDAEFQPLLQKRRRLIDERETMRVMKRTNCNSALANSALWLQP